MHTGLSTPVIVLALTLSQSVVGCGDVFSTANPVTSPAVTSQQSEDSKSIEQVVNLRQLEIPKREHGYRNFDSCLLTSEADLEAFIAEVKIQEGWNHRGDFVSGLRSAKIDFAQSTLLLLRHTEGSGSLRIWLEQAVIRGDELIVRIGRNLPSAGTKDMLTTASHSQSLMVLPSEYGSQIPSHLREL